MDLENFDYPEFAKYEVVDSSNFVNFGSNEACVLGIDEAGRGPTLGPMVYAVAVSPVSLYSELKPLGLDDSKALTEAKRDIIFKKMVEDEWTRERLAYRLNVISPRMISAKMMMEGSKGALNEMSHSSCIDLIQACLDNGINVKEIYVDTVGPKDKYQKKLAEIFGKKIKIVVSEKADSKFPIVSAASIAAKVTRDERVKNWVFEEGEKDLTRDYGSGYPSDPKTKKWIAANCHPVYGFPSIVRFSWGTAQKIMEKQCCKVNWDPYNQKVVEKKSKFGKRPVLTLDNFFTKAPPSKK
uniref:Ribonuclease n=1 Tax=Rhabditophanes sp. KR3021 TaxID=114890 RepID=A0AC35TUU7_9BILA